MICKQSEYHLKVFLYKINCNYSKNKYFPVRFNVLGLMALSLVILLLNADCKRESGRHIPPVGRCRSDVFHLKLKTAHRYSSFVYCGWSPSSSRHPHLAPLKQKVDFRKLHARTKSVKLHLFNSLSPAMGLFEKSRRRKFAHSHLHNKKYPR